MTPFSISISILTRVVFSQTQGIYVESIVEGGTAHVEGGLRIKDRLLAVNDADLTDATKAEAIKVTSSCYALP